MLNNKSLWCGNWKGTALWGHSESPLLHLLKGQEMAIARGRTPYLLAWWCDGVWQLIY